MESSSTAPYNVHWPKTSSRPGRSTGRAVVVTICAECQQPWPCPTAYGFVSIGPDYCTAHRGIRDVGDEQCDAYTRDDNESPCVFAPLGYLDREAAR